MGGAAEASPRPMPVRVTTGTTTHHKYKTALCSVWQLASSCPRGDKCAYAHGVQELRRHSGTGLTDNGKDGAPSSKLATSQQVASLAELGRRIYQLLPADGSFMEVTTLGNTYKGAYSTTLKADSKALGYATVGSLVRAGPSKKLEFVADNHPGQFKVRRVVLVTASLPPTLPSMAMTNQAPIESLQPAWALSLHPTVCRVLALLPLDGSYISEYDLANRYSQTHFVTLAEDVQPLGCGPRSLLTQWIPPFWLEVVGHDQTGQYKVRRLGPLPPSAPATTLGLTAQASSCGGEAYLHGLLSCLMPTSTGLTKNRMKIRLMALLPMDGSAVSGDAISQRYIRLYKGLLPDDARLLGSGSVEELIAGLPGLLIKAGTGCPEAMKLDTDKFRLPDSNLRSQAKELYRTFSNELCTTASTMSRSRASSPYSYYHDNYGLAGGSVPLSTPCKESETVLQELAGYAFCDKGMETAYRALKVLEITTCLQGGQPWECPQTDKAEFLQVYLYQYKLLQSQLQSQFPQHQPARRNL